MSNLFELSRSKAIFNLDPAALAVRVESHQLLALVLRSATNISKKTIENTRKLLEEAREAHRQLANQERRTNDYQRLSLRQPSQPNR